MKDLTTIAKINNLEVIDTTSERNGYPSNLKKGIIGFENFKDAKALAEEYNLEITTFDKKDGWSLWFRTGATTYEPFLNSCEDYGDNYSEIKKTDEESFILDEVKYFFEDENNLESFEIIEAFLKAKKVIWDEVQKMEDDEIVITHEGNYYETIKKTSMYWSHDTKHHVIGLQEK